MFKDLETLIISNVSLSSIKLDDTKFGENLKQLNLSSNKLKELPENLFHHNNYITLIDLSHNQINKIGENVFCPESLGTLILRNNQINDFNSKDCSFLTKLDLSQNIIEDIKDILSLPNLNYLNLDSNKISTIIKDKLNHMKHLSLNHNNITEFNLEFTNPHSLQLTHNQIKKFKIQSNTINLNISYNELVDLEFDENTALLELDVSNNNLKTFNTQPLSKMSNLITFNLSHNKIDEFNFEPLAKLKNLKTLNLNNNKLTKISFGTNQNYSIENLYLSQNDLNINDFNEIIKSMKNLKILSVTSEKLICTDLEKFIINANKTNIKISDENENLISEAASKKTSCIHIKDQTPTSEHSKLFWWFFIGFVVLAIICLIGRYFYFKRKNIRNINISE